jgi:hypothetical protein
MTRLLAAEPELVEELRAAGTAAKVLPKGRNFH